MDAVWATDPKRAKAHARTFEDLLSALLAQRIPSLFLTGFVAAPRGPRAGAFAVR